MEGANQMKGATELKFTEATMMEAMQEYLDLRFKESPGKVTAVTLSTHSGNGYNAGDFIVKITHPETTG